MEPLPMMPEPPPKPARRAKGSAMAVTRIRTQRLCDDCCADIHRLGQAAAPYPRGARWRISTTELLVRVCEKHKEIRCG